MGAARVGFGGDGIGDCVICLQVEDGLNSRGRVEAAKALRVAANAEKEVD